MIDGRGVGPPLGVRSITATVDGAVLLVNVHVGGIPRSIDGGVTWQPTIEIDTDVHEVRAHPTPAWYRCHRGRSVHQQRRWRDLEGRARGPARAGYCSAVAFAGDDVLVAASTDPFAAQGAIYRRPVDGPGPLVVVGGGLPSGPRAGRTPVASPRAERPSRSATGGNLYVSADAGPAACVAPRPSGLPPPKRAIVPRSVARPSFAGSRN